MMGCGVFASRHGIEFLEYHSAIQIPSFIPNAFTALARLDGAIPDVSGRPNTSSTALYCSLISSSPS